MRAASWRHAPLSRLDGDRRRESDAPARSAHAQHAARRQRRRPASTCASSRWAGLTEQDAGGESSSSSSGSSSGGHLPPQHVTSLNSLSNAYVKHAVRVGSSRSYREESGTGLLAGGRLLTEVAQALSSRNAGPLRPRVLLLADGAPVPEGVEPERLIRASAEVLRKVAGVENGDSVDAVAELTTPPLVTPTPQQIRDARRVLVLDGVQDPGNVGTLLRTAAAFRWSAIALLPGCCDPFNPKAVRASRGACFRMPLWRLASWAQAQALCSGISVTCLAADAGGDDTGRVLERAAAGGGDVGGDRLWLALGAEGQGLSEGAMQACTRVAIPGADGMESLNVAVAGSILLYALHPHR